MIGTSYKPAPEMIREDSDVRVSELMRKKGCTGAHCGNCKWWLTPWKAEDGELLGWIGVCNNSRTDEIETEADDYCPRHEPDWIAGPDGKRYYQGMGGCPSTPRMTEAGR